MPHPCDYQELSDQVFISLGFRTATKIILFSHACATWRRDVQQPKHRPDKTEGFHFAWAANGWRSFGDYKNSLNENKCSFAPAKSNTC